MEQNHSILGSAFNVHGETRTLRIDEEDSQFNSRTISHLRSGFALFHRPRIATVAAIRYAALRGRLAPPAEAPMKKRWSAVIPLCAWHGMLSAPALSQPGAALRPAQTESNRSSDA